MDKIKFLNDYIKHTITVLDGCIIWTAGRNSDGYGHMTNGGKDQRIHRLAYEFFIGPIPEGLLVDHLCRTRECVNPLHLEVVTNRENILRGTNRKRDQTHCLRGHEFTEKNTYINPKTGRRDCMKCKKFRRNRHYRWHGRG